MRSILVARRLEHQSHEEQLSFGSVSSLSPATRQTESAMAVAHSLLVIVYHVLCDKKPYSDLGADYFNNLDKERLTRQALRRLEALVYDVTLSPKQEEVS